MHDTRGAAITAPHGVQAAADGTFELRQHVVNNSQLYTSVHPTANKYKPQLIILQVNETDVFGVDRCTLAAAAQLSSAFQADNSPT